MRNGICFMLLLTFGTLCFAYYGWPLTNVFDRTCNSTFGEYRYNSDPSKRHLHEGIDIYPVDTHNEIYCTWQLHEVGYEVEKIRNLGTQGYAVTVQHYNFTVSNSETTWIEQDHGSRYLHMVEDPSQHLRFGFRYPNDIYIIENSRFYNDHLHFEIRKPAPSEDDYQNALNPMIVHSNLCPEDDNKPTLLSLYVDGDPFHQGNAEFECWNFLNYTFNQYYDANSAPPFIRLILPMETPNEDLDDPHFLIGGNRKARFVLCNQKLREAESYGWIAGSEGIRKFLNRPLERIWQILYNDKMILRDERIQSGMRLSLSRVKSYLMDRRPPIPENEMNSRLIFKSDQDGLGRTALVCYAQVLRSFYEVFRR